MIKTVTARVLVAVAASLALGLGACSSSPQTSPSPSGGEIFLAPRTDTGTDPFTPSAADDAVALTPESSATPSPAPSASSAGITSFIGTTPRTYAGDPDVPACDRQQIINALAADPAKAAAWAKVLGIDVSQISTYLARLAAVVLRADTRVTNHTFSGGVAHPFQYVLQAGTAVLVDAYGLPRVRCACGNPLTEPVAVTVTPSYVGSKWQGFDPGAFQVVTPGPIIVNLTIVNVFTGSDYRVPVGPPLPTSPTATVTATQSPTASASGATPSTDFTNCTRRYGELVKELTLAGTLTGEQAQRWAEQAEQAAQAARSGDVAGALAICDQTVAEMEQALGG